MSDAPKRMWREIIALCEMYPDGGAFYHETKPSRPADEYHRADLSADLVRAGLEAASEMCEAATMDDVGDIIRGIGADIRALSADPEVIAAIVASVIKDTQ